MGLLSIVATLCPNPLLKPSYYPLAAKSTLRVLCLAQCLHLNCATCSPAITPLHLLGTSNELQKGCIIVRVYTINTAADHLKWIFLAITLIEKWKTCTVFPSSYRNTSESLGEREIRLFRVLPNFHDCFYSSIETRWTCFLFILENTAKQKRK